MIEGAARRRRPGGLWATFKLKQTAAHHMHPYGPMDFARCAVWCGTRRPVAFFEVVSCPIPNQAWLRIKVTIPAHRSTSEGTHHAHHQRFSPTRRRGQRPDHNLQRCPSAGAPARPNRAAGRYSRYARTGTQSSRMPCWCASPLNFDVEAVKKVLFQRHCRHHFERS